VDRATLEREVDAFVAAQRDRCLWFMRRDYLPHTDDERRWVLTEIQRRADRATFVRASELERWLSPISNAASAES
jgi:MoxR-like ATPase